MEGSISCFKRQDSVVDEKDRSGFQGNLTRVNPTTKTSTTEMGNILRLNGTQKFQLTQPINPTLSPFAASWIGNPVWIVE